MVGFLLDTMAVSELRRGRSNPGFTDWARQQPRRAFWLSTMTIAELRRGLLQLERDGRLARAAELTEWFKTLLPEYFEQRILTFDRHAAEAWARLTHDWTPGRAPPVIDSQIAAIALANGLTVVTRNTRDSRQFEQRGVSLLNPWTD